MKRFQPTPGAAFYNRACFTAPPSCFTLTNTSTNNVPHGLFYADDDSEQHLAHLGRSGDPQSNSVYYISRSGLLVNDALGLPMRQEAGTDDAEAGEAANPLLFPTQDALLNFQEEPVLAICDTETGESNGSLMLACTGYEGADTFYQCDTGLVVLGDAETAQYGCEGVILTVAAS